MNEDTIKKIERELQHAANSDINHLSLKVEVKLLKNDSINASVRKNINTQMEYTIHIYTGVFDSLKLALEEKYNIAKMDEENFLLYQFSSTSTTHQHYDNSTLQTSFMDIMVKFISHNILFHECGHILLGHCDSRMARTSEQVNKLSHNGGYGLQAREMMADWYGIKRAMKILLYSFDKSCHYNVKEKNDLIVIRKALFTALLALFCQFDLFEASSGSNMHEFTAYNLSLRSHPHPYIRLLYGCDVIKESVMDVIESSQSLNDTVSEEIVDELLNTTADDLLNFLDHMGLNNVKSSLWNPNLIECYYLIWKKAALEKHSTKPYINMKMQKMSTEYLNSIRKCKGLYR